MARGPNRRHHRARIPSGGSGDGTPTIVDVAREVELDIIGSTHPRRVLDLMESFTCGLGSDTVMLFQKAEGTLLIGGRVRTPILRPIKIGLGFCSFGSPL